MLKGCVFPEEPKVRLTRVEINSLEDFEVQTILHRVSPALVWRKGDTLVIRGFRDLYEFQEVRRRIVGDLKRFLVVSVESYAFCSDDNLVKRV
jgi:hypothetical protein